MSRRKTTSEFISQAQAVHNGKYDYSKVTYIDSNTKVCIICPIHGEFEQKPVVHVNMGCGCPKCAAESISSKLADTKEDFILKAQKIHGDRYDYSKVEYINNSTYVTIICQKHGEFRQYPCNHIKGSGCPYCQNKRENQISFLEKARAVHGNRYDYSKAKYAAHGEKLCVTCKKHGDFYVLPSHHISGSGCPKCARESRRSLVLGKGICDIETPKEDKIRKRWQGILERCYAEQRRHRAPTYQDCSICKEWLVLSKFKEWHDDPTNGYQEGYHLDKDILVKGNKIYSPETCCFVPAEINEQFRRVAACRGKYPVGVRKMKSRYAAYLNGKFLGSATTPEDAFIFYKQAKEDRIKELATKYYSIRGITQRVYEAMMRYEVEITD
ncbi:MAG: hypothetical protein K2K45_05090 [Muribaculaceae bacterium]|nr:hypothetical protein [Muribaculaceae bacterium]